MSDQLISQISELFDTELEISVPGPQVDLIEEGLLDSLIFVDLIMHLETRFEVEIPVADLEFDQFRTIKGIADFILSLSSSDQTQEAGSAA